MIRSIVLFFIFSIQLHANEAEPLARSYGYVIGDILEQRVALTRNGDTIELAQLPIEQRVGPWVHRLSAQTSVDEQGKPWLSMRYQIINAPAQAREVVLPAMVISTTSSKPFELASQTFSLMPLTLERHSGKNNLPFMLPDKMPALANNQAAWQKLRLTLLALFTASLVWFCWWLWLRQHDKTTLAFSKAVHQLRQLRKSTEYNINDNTAAWSAVHEAFNTLAGQTLSSRTALILLDKQRWLEPFRTEIESFYKASDKRFFNPDTSPTPFELMGFCRALSRAEKRHSAAADAGLVRES